MKSLKVIGLTTILTLLLNTSIVMKSKSEVLKTSTVVVRISKGPGIKDDPKYRLIETGGRMFDLFFKYYTKVIIKNIKKVDVKFYEESILFNFPRKELPPPYSEYEITVANGGLDDRPVFTDIWLKNISLLIMRDDREEELICEDSPHKTPVYQKDKDRYFVEFTVTTNGTGPNAYYAYIR